MDNLGELSELKLIVNCLIEHLRDSFCEVSRIAREADKFTEQTRKIHNVAKAETRGNLSGRLTMDAKHENQELVYVINVMVDRLQEGTEIVRMYIPDISGSWKELTDVTNTMAANQTTQVRSVTEATSAVARGDLSKSVEVETRGEIMELKTTINSMVEAFRTIVAEITRVAREVGIEGELESQAVVEDVNGTWKELADSINTMISNLTASGRSTADFTRVAVAEHEQDH
ncbi:hypothetical protein B0O80DRAFT_422682 [Mortierella sp. GBAus27b]|nr:hypothetical protein B0O80DRAFT_422682 [Mortierella sp. GBAus27b]